MKKCMNLQLSGLEEYNDLHNKSSVAFASPLASLQGENTVLHCHENDALNN